MVDIRSFRTARRGYDREEVLNAISDATGKVEQLELDRAAAEKTVERLTRELTDLRGVLKRASSKPTSERPGPMEWACINWVSKVGFHLSTCGVGMTEPTSQETSAIIADTLR